MLFNCLMRSTASLIINTVINLGKYTSKISLLTNSRYEKLHLQHCNWSALPFSREHKCIWIILQNAELYVRNTDHHSKVLYLSFSSCFNKRSCSHESQDARTRFTKSAKTAPDVLWRPLKILTKNNRSVPTEALACFSGPGIQSKRNCPNTE